MQSREVVGTKGKEQRPQQGGDEDKLWFELIIKSKGVEKNPLTAETKTDLNKGTKMKNAQGT